MIVPILSRNSSLYSSQQYEKITNSTTQDTKQTFVSSTRNLSTNSPLLYKSTATYNNSTLFSSTATQKPIRKFQKQEQQIKHMCLIHKKKFIYDCINCKQNVCMDCLVDTKNHRDHRFQRYNEKKQDLRQRYKQLKEQINFKKTQINYIIQCRQNQINQLKNQKQNAQILKIKNSQKKIQQTQNQSLQLIQNECITYKTIFQQFNDYYQINLSQLQNTNKVALICKTGILIESNLIKNIKQITQTKIPTIKQQNQLQSFIKPNYHINIFTVQNFTKIKQTSNEKIFQCYEAFKSIWRIKIYPGGYPGAKIDERHKGIDYMSIYAQRVDGILQQSQFSIQIEITSRVDPRLRIKKQFKSLFKKNQSWGYDRYTRIQNIYSHGFLGEDDTLFVKVSIRPINFYETCRALNQVIIQKQKLQNQNERKIKILRIMLDNKLKNSKKIENLKNQKLIQPQTIKNQSKIKFLNQQQPLKNNEHILFSSQLNLFKSCLDKKNQQQQKGKIVDRTGTFALTRNRTSEQLPSISLQKRSPNKLIRLVSLKNVQLIENSRKKLHNRSNTFF